jgi:hypothetical protein
MKGRDIGLWDLEKAREGKNIGRVLYQLSVQLSPLTSVWYWDALKSRAASFSDGFARTAGKAAATTSVDARVDLIATMIAVG